MARNAKLHAEVPSSPAAGEVEAHLERLLEAAEFRQSRRCQEFLRYVVRRVLEGAGDSIKERTVAVDVFGRGVDFNPAQDSLVRVKAAEVRGRLARYYESQGASESIRIDLPVGSYVPEFYRAATLPQSAAPRPQRVRKLAPWLAGFLLLAGAIAMGVLWNRPPEVDRLWQPMLSAGRPLLICVPGMRLMGPANGRTLRDATVSGIDGRGRTVYRLDPGEFVARDDVVGMGAAVAAARISALVSSMGHPITVKAGDESTFSDLRAQPAVLLGAFSSRWTIEMNKDMRFRFTNENGASAIVDSKTPGRKWLMPRYTPDGRTLEDYGMVSRVFHSQTGQPLLIAAGFTTFGTQSAVELIVEPDLLRRLLGKAPEGWEQLSFQAILHTRVIGNTPGPPEIVATHFW
ncbi:MAG: hypothetical protein JNL98_28980 [Bryobacterales bacterium]|nr:hypothetical protein [Bryobacterales bacterium]